MTLQNQVARGLKWQAIMTGGRQVLSLAIFAILARLLDPEDFGLMGLTYIYLMFAGILVDPGICTALVQRVNPESRHWDAAFWFNVGCALLLCVVTILLADPIARLCGEPKFATVLQWSALGIVFSSGSFVHATKFTKEIDFGRVAIRNLSAQVIAGGIGLTMAFAGYGVWSLVGQQLAGALFGTIFLWVASPYRPAFTFSWLHFRDLSQVSARVLLTNLLSLVGSRVDQFIIGRFAGTSALGLYLVAGKIPEIVRTSTQQPLLEIMVPTMSKLQGDKARMTQAIYRGMELNAAIVFPVYVGIAVVSSDLLALFGPRWKEASSLCSLLSLYALLGAINVYHYPALLATGLTRRFFLLNCFLILGNVVACLVGIQFGVAYVALGLIANSLVMLFPFLSLLNARIGLDARAYYKPCIAPACAAAVMATAVFSVSHSATIGVEPWVRLSLHVPIGVCLYIGTLYLLSRSTIHTLRDFTKRAIRSRHETQPG